MTEGLNVIRRKFSRSCTKTLYQLLGQSKLDLSERFQFGVFWMDSDLLAMVKHLTGKSDLTLGQITYRHLNLINVQTIRKFVEDKDDRRITFFNNIFCMYAHKTDHNITALDSRYLKEVDVHKIVNGESLDPSSKPDFTLRKFLIGNQELVMVDDFLVAPANKIEIRGDVSIETTDVDPISFQGHEKILAFNFICKKM